MTSSSTRPRFGALVWPAALLAATVAALALAAPGCGTGTITTATALDSPVPQPAPDPQPALPNCDCYYASDCKKWFGEKTVCDRNKGNGGSGGQETKCKFMKPKPNKDTNEKGCTTSTGGTPSTCDGHCIKPVKGSTCGVADRLQVARAVELWSEAFIQPAAAGGGTVNAGLVAESRALGLSAECNGQVARTVLSLIELAWSDILIHPETPHVEEHHGIPDLSADTCRLQAAAAASRALVDVLEVPGSQPTIGAEVLEACPGELPFADPCLGADAIACAESLIQDLAVYLSTPPVAVPTEEETTAALFGAG
jgi:hypothetical protein